MGITANEAIQQYRSASKERKDAQTKLDQMKDEYQAQKQLVEDLTSVMTKKREQLIKVAEYIETSYQD